jgi:hypothetical protein
MVDRQAEVVVVAEEAVQELHLHEQQYHRHSIHHNTRSARRCIHDELASRPRRHDEQLEYRFA